MPEIEFNDSTDPEANPPPTFDIEGPYTIVGRYRLVETPSRFAWLTELLARIFKRKPAPRPHVPRAPSEAQPPLTDGGTMVAPEPSAEAINDAIAEARAEQAGDRLSRNFKLSEFTASDTAKRFGLDNSAPPEILAHLFITAAGMERVREALGGKPIIVTSGYRSPEVNAKVGSKPGSAHCQGWAVDFKCPSVGKPADIVRILKHAADGDGLEFDQLINEYDAWVHISFDPRARGQVFRIG